MAVNNLQLPSIRLWPNSPNSAPRYSQSPFPCEMLSLINLAPLRLLWKPQNVAIPQSGTIATTPQSSEFHMLPTCSVVASVVASRHPSKPTRIVFFRPLLQCSAPTEYSSTVLAHSFLGKDLQAAAVGADLPFCLNLASWPNSLLSADQLSSCQGSHRPALLHSTTSLHA